MTRRPFFVGLAAVLAIVTTALGVQAAFDAEKQSEPPHAARSTASVQTGPLPLSVVGGEHPQDVIGWLDGIARAEWFAGVERAEQEAAAAAEAERLRAAQPARLSSVAPSGSGAPAAPPAASDGGCAYADAIREAWAGTGDEQWAVNTAIRESHCQPGARNPSGASGIFQLMMPLHRAFVAGICGEPADELVFEAWCNITAARAMYDGSGRRPWNF